MKINDVIYSNEHRFLKIVETSDDEIVAVKVNREGDILDETRYTISIDNVFEVKVRKKK